MMAAGGGLWATRSVLFMPGGRADMIAKIAVIEPDVAVVDLEDAVAPVDKDAARAVAASAIDALRPGGSVILVRLNPVDSSWWVDDVRAAAATSATG